MIPNAKSKIKDFEIEVVKEFPVSIFKEEQLYGKILEYMKQLERNFLKSYGKKYINQIEIIVTDIKESKNFNCNQIMALFLLYIYKFTSRDFYIDIVFFIISYRKMLNEKGKENCSKLDGGFLR